MKRLLPILMTCLALTTAKGQDWPHLQFDAANTGYYPYTNSAPIRDCTTDTDGDSTNDDIYVVSWRWYPATSTETNLHTSISGLIQPIIVSNIVLVGYFNDHLYAIDAINGTTVWSYAAGGPITHTAGVESNKVVFPCEDGTLYCVNLLDGADEWKFKPGRRPWRTAPCIRNGKCYIGNTDGKLYAVDMGSGTADWSYASGAPILTSAACDTNDNIYCGNEGCVAFSVDSSGSERWSTQLVGQSMMSYWPVLDENNQRVVYRTQPPQPFHTHLSGGDDAVRVDSNGVMRASTAANNPSHGQALNDIAAEQQRIREYLASNDWQQTCFVLNMANGNEIIPRAPILYTSGEGTLPTPPVLDRNNNTWMCIWRSYYAQFDGDGMVRYYSDLGKMNTSSLDIEHFANPKSRFEVFHLIGDETAILTMMPNYLWVTSSARLGGIRLSDEVTFHAVNVEDGQGGSPYVFGVDPAWLNLPWGAGGTSGGQLAGTSFGSGRAYCITSTGVLICMEPQP